MAQHDPDGMRLPIKIDSTSNGEFKPIALTRRNKIGNEEALKAADQNARKTGVSRRSFLVSASGAATTLLAFNEINAAAGKTGGFFEVASEAAFDDELAHEMVGGDEFIFDVQGHYVDPNWANRLPDGLPAGARPFLNIARGRGCKIESDEGFDYLQCVGKEAFIKDVFLDSDTDMMVLSMVPSPMANEPVTIQEADAVRRIVDEMEGTHRLLLHGRVNPNQPGDLESMDGLAADWDISAWKTYTQYGPDRRGYFMDDEETGIPFIEKALALGINNICIHKGMPFGAQSYEHSQCRDIGVVARQYPDMNFIIYHSGYVPSKAEEAFVASAADQDGINTLIQSLIDNDIAPNSNVYAELGSTWRRLMQDPDGAAHAFGKMIQYVGEDNILWGTDSIWYGSPQDQIQAFRSFQISEQYQEEFGYSPITPEIKAKIFGLNATVPYKISAEEVKLRSVGDKISSRRLAYADKQDPHFETFGPRNRREFMQLAKLSGGARF